MSRSSLDRGDVLFFVFLASLVLAIAAAFACLISAADEDEWTKVNDNCFLHVFHNKHIFHDDPESRLIYCVDHGEN